jgi:aspartyl-tRNA(Asn)/glutamyl-tRNA(Gln) amidotransferase subunit B
LQDGKVDARFAKLVANWVVNEVARKRADAEMMGNQIAVDPHTLGILVLRVMDGTINGKTAKELFNQFWEEDGLENRRGPNSVDAIIEAKGLKQMNDTGELEKIIDEVLAANPKNAEEFKAGNAKALNGLVGPIMKASKGKANPAQVNELLKRKLT